MNLKSFVPACIFIGALTFFPKSAVAQYVQSNLVADRAGLNAPNTDPNLINAWGLTRCRIPGIDEGGLFCVADAFAGVVTVYTHSGKKVPVTINVPPASVPLAPFGVPTGIVFNTTRNFVISENGKSAPAVLLIAGLDGTISGWNPNVDAANAVIIFDFSVSKPNRPFPASYTGLTMARNSAGQNVLYAADSGGSLTTSNNEIDMFDGNFQTIGHFTDLNTNLPNNPGMTVYNVQNVSGKIFATFATFTLLGGGVVDIFDTDGNLLTPEHFASNPGNSGAGPLEAPWGVALTPDDFGMFSNAILIGGVDDGHISAFDPHTQKFLAQLKDAKGNLLIGTDGLWALLSAGDDGDSNQVFFAAGANGYADGLFGVITPANQNNQNGDAVQNSGSVSLASPTQRPQAGRPHRPN